MNETIRMREANVVCSRARTRLCFLCSVSTTFYVLMKLVSTYVCNTFCVCVFFHLASFYFIFLSFVNIYWIPKSVFKKNSKVLLLKKPSHTNSLWWRSINKCANHTTKMEIFVIFPNYEIEHTNEMSRD